jgi:hypothetical protein
MGKKSEIERSEPIYVQTADGIVTLVGETETSEIGPTNGPRMATSRPHAAHVIDAEGVRSVPISTVDRKQILLALPAILGTPLLYLWLSRRQTNEQKRKR